MCVRAWVGMCACAWVVCAWVCVWEEGVGNMGN